jgi:hypothetical protein
MTESNTETGCHRPSILDYTTYNLQRHAMNSDNKQKRTSDAGGTGTKQVSTSVRRGAAMGYLPFVFRERV